MEETKLAIIIPAFKGNFLEKTLISIDNQTCKKFNLYIGDDASPEDLYNIVKKFISRINIYFIRFDENLGGKSLTKQWERCINLSLKEQYIWLFSDDDEMPNDAVERFYKITEKGSFFDIYRFNIQFIDEKDRIIRVECNNPYVESSKEFIKRRLTFSTLSAACEYIFSRVTYISNNGFVEFPLAWCSDDATWAKFGKEKGICTIFGDPIKMRMVKGYNISSIQSNNITKFKAIIAFLFWLKKENDFKVENIYLIKYLISQIRELSIKLHIRIIYLISILKLIGFISTIAVVINRAKTYKLLIKNV